MAENICHKYFLLNLILIFTIISCTRSVKDVPYYTDNLDGTYDIEVQPWVMQRVRRAVVDDNATATTQAATTALPDVQVTTETPTTKKPSTATTKATTTPSSTPRTVPPKLEGAIVTEGNHSYYLSSIIDEDKGGSGYWINIDTMPGASIVRHDTLSNSHRVASVVDMPFDFLFYGHKQSKITIATGGFIYMSEFLHQWLTATQYIAPLMANFDTKIGNDSHIYYASNSTHFVVEWQNVYVQDHPGDGSFHFQATLMSNNVIIFAYKKVPISVDNISTTNHPVKIGLSDAYYYDKYIPEYNIKRRTIYEYHRVDITSDKYSYIRPSVSIVFTPLPTCNIFKECTDCLRAKIGFDCGWCQSARRCSNGLDRYRQEWLSQGCPAQLEKSCEGLPIEATKKPKQTGDGGTTAIIVVVVLIIIAIFGSGVAWVVYAYKNPNSRAGIWLIENRPSQIAQKIQFWKGSGDGTGEKYAVSGVGEGATTA